MARKLSDEFIKDLKTGQLKEILELVKTDESLDLENRKKL